MTQFTLSKNTTSILRNFFSINAGLYFRQGNVLRTTSKDDDMFIRAEISETIPNDFGIYDLSKFLQVLDLYENPLLELEADQVLKITGNGSTYEYTLSSKKTIKSFDEKQEANIDKLDERYKDSKTKFDLSAVSLQRLKKVLQVAGMTEVIFTSDGKNISIKGSKKSDPTFDQYKAVLSEQNSQPFSLMFSDYKIQNLMEGDYTVSMIPAMTQFKRNGGKLIYYVAPETGSKEEK